MRKAYTTRRSGRSVRVPASRIRDRGAPGKWTTVNRSAGIGPLKKGRLSAVGYSSTASPASRHRAIGAAVERYGAVTTLRMLNAVAVYTKRTSPSRSRTFKADVRYVQDKYM